MVNCRYFVYDMNNSLASRDIPRFLAPCDAPFPYRPANRSAFAVFVTYALPAHNTALLQIIRQRSVAVKTNYYTITQQMAPLVDA